VFNEFLNLEKYLKHDNLLDIDGLEDWKMINQLTFLII